MDILKDTFLKIISDIFEPIESEFKQIVKNRILEYTTEEFNRNLYVKTILYRTTPKKLYDFYHPINLREFDSSNPKNIKVLKRVVTTKSIKNLFEEKQFISIIGPAGCGKSTLIKYLYLNCVETNYKIPIIVELRYLNEYNGTFKSYVFDEIFKLNKLAVSDNIIEKLLETDKFIFFLDGYDELKSTKKESLTKQLNDFIKVFEKCQYLLTSRPFTGIEYLPLFRNYEVCELTDNEITQFTTKILSKNDREIRDKIITAAMDKENAVLKSFLKNPLLLSMFILTYQSYARIPQKISYFYQYVFDALYSHHDSVAKMAFEREKQSGLSKEEFIQVLRLISFITHFEEKFVFSEIYMNILLNRIKEKKESLQFDNEKLIEDLLVAIGIISKEGFEFTFPHRSLQEYFAASYVASLSNQNKEIAYQKLIEKSPLNKSLSNFTILLKELDSVNFIKLAIIPELQNISKRIDNVHRTAHATFSHFYIEIYQTLFALGLLLQEDNNDYFKMQRDKRENSNQAYLEYSKSLKKTILRILHDLSSNLMKSEKSDFDIINII